MKTRLRLDKPRRTQQGHPGTWPDGESAEIRELYDLTIAGSALEPPRIVPRRAYRPRKGTQ